uniref:Alternative oxidase n=1 Tax=Komagataella pastoris TaxID=4922 RepID=A4K8T8_PICPA|nr:mitochondrial alternative oxidase [Komagataella pastoris]
MLKLYAIRPIRPIKPCLVASTFRHYSVKVDTSNKADVIKDSQTDTTSKPGAEHGHTLGQYITKKLMVRQRLPTEKGDDSFLTPPAMPHHGYRQDLMEKIHYEHREPTLIRDKLAFGLMRSLRVCFDFFSGYKHPKTKEGLEKLTPATYQMTPEKWLTRFIILESIAGVPGSVASFLRHLQSLRLLKRDKAFIQTLQDEAYNERMHLLTFLEIGKPGPFMKVLLYASQGVFCNLFFFTYMLAPNACHRFVGYLEEEAVYTYTTCLEDIERGLLPDIEHFKVPKIAKDYWHLSEDAKMRDLISYIRADEAKHREVNHTFANLKLDGTDRNPFALQVDSVPESAQPNNRLSTHKAVGWERDELVL